MDRRPRQMPDRFWDKVARLEDGCWEWVGARWRNALGVETYGQFVLDNRVQPAHRVAWELERGPIPAGKWVLHNCDNKGCVRPDHLYVGTHADNTRDAVRRRRMWSGERSWNHKLREVDVTAIRALAAAGFASEQVGPLFHVSGSAVRYIVRNVRWRKP